VRLTGQHWVGVSSVIVAAARDKTLKYQMAIPIAATGNEPAYLAPELLVWNHRTIAATATVAPITNIIR
jgi:hypothetical protein